MELTAIIKRDGAGYVALCPQVNVASQGSSVEQTLENLREAIELFCEVADPKELAARLHDGAGGM